MQAQQSYSEFQHGIWTLLNHASNLNIPDARTYRQIRYYSVVGPAALAPDQLDRVNLFHSVVPHKMYIFSFLYEVQQINQRHAGHLQHGLNMQLQRSFPLRFEAAT